MMKTSPLLSFSINTHLLKDTSRAHNFKSDIVSHFLVKAFLHSEKRKCKSAL